jgi:NAD-dependent dihydropyrimidine dehydrogenase PreA subunit
MTAMFPHIHPLARAVHPKMQDIHHMYEVIEKECTGCADCLPYCPEPGALVQY